MTKSVDVLIVGGGLNGFGLAYYLAKEGLTDILLLEADVYGSGATAGSMGNIRQQGFGTALEIECSRRGLEFWKTIEDQFGVPVPFHEDGYLLLSGDETTAQILRDQAELQRSLGMTSVEILDPAGIKEVVPFLAVDDLIVGSWTPEDGHTLPADGMTVLSQAARELGVKSQPHTKVEAIQRQADGRWLATGNNPVSAREVIIAAGAGTKDLLKPFGIDIDIYIGEHHGLLTSEAFPGQRIPTVIDLDTGMCVEREGQGLMLAMLARNPAPRDHDHLVEMFMEAAENRAPVLTDLRLTHRLKAYPTLGGDGHPYVGRVDPNLWALAFTGHGAMHGPPVAEALAREVAGRPDATLDLSEWDVRREVGTPTVLWRRKATG